MSLSFFLLVPFVHELLDALGAQDHLDQREFALTVLHIREWELQSRQGRLIVFSMAGIVQRAPGITACCLAGSGNDFVFGTPAQRELGYDEYVSGVRVRVAELGYTRSRTCSASDHRLQTLGRGLSSISSPFGHPRSVMRLSHPLSAETCRQV